MTGYKGEKVVYLQRSVLNLSEYSLWLGVAPLTITADSVCR